MNLKRSFYSLQPALLCKQTDEGCKVVFHQQSETSNTEMGVSEEV